MTCKQRVVFPICNAWRIRVGFDYKKNFKYFNLHSNILCVSMVHEKAPCGV